MALTLITVRDRKQVQVRFRRTSTATMLRLFVLLLLAAVLEAFSPCALVSSTPALFSSASDNHDPSEIVGRRIIVSGDVQGGYYRSCVANEAGKFRRLRGSMSPPDPDSDVAEIYVEGERKMVDGFVRWAKRGNVGLSQVITVKEVIEEEPEGLYDEFYVQTR